MIKIGDVVSVRSPTLPTSGQYTVLKRHTGRVIYIHPRGRWCLIEFKAGTRGGTVRECFFLRHGEIFVTGLEKEAVSNAVQRIQTKRDAENAERLERERKQARKDYIREYQRKRREQQKREAARSAKENEKKDL